MGRSLWQSLRFRLPVNLFRGTTGRNRPHPSSGPSRTSPAPGSPAKPAKPPSLPPAMARQPRGHDAPPATTPRQPQSACGLKSSQTSYFRVSYRERRQLLPEESGGKKRKKWSLPRTRARDRSVHSLTDGAGAGCSACSCASRVMRTATSSSDVGSPPPTISIRGWADCVLLLPVPFFEGLSGLPLTVGCFRVYVASVPLFL